MVEWLAEQAVQTVEKISGEFWVAAGSVVGGLVAAVGVLWKRMLDVQAEADKRVDAARRDLVQVLRGLAGLEGDAEEED